VVMWRRTRPGPGNTNHGRSLSASAVSGPVSTGTVLIMGTIAISLLLLVRILAASVVLWDFLPASYWSTAALHYKPNDAPFCRPISRLVGPYGNGYWPQLRRRANVPSAHNVNVGPRIVVIGDIHGDAAGLIEVNAIQFIAVLRIVIRA
jgi:hypothetical protein